MSGKKEVGVIHSYLCGKIIEKRDSSISDPNELIINRNDFRRMLGWFNIPYYIQCKVIKEMQDMGLIKIRDKQNIILVRPKKRDDGWFE